MPAAKNHKTRACLKTNVIYPTIYIKTDARSEVKLQIAYRSPSVQQYPTWCWLIKIRSRQKGQTDKLNEATVDLYPRSSAVFCERFLPMPPSDPRDSDDKKYSKYFIIVSQWINLSSAKLYSIHFIKKQPRLSDFLPANLGSRPASIHMSRWWRREGRASAQNWSRAPKTPTLHVDRSELS